MGNNINSSYKANEIRKENLITAISYKCKVTVLDKLDYNDLKLINSLLNKGMVV